MRLMLGAVVLGVIVPLYFAADRPVVERGGVQQQPDQRIQAVIQLHGGLAALVGGAEPPAAGSGR